MLQSRSLQDLCCLTQAALFNTCLARDDLRRLGVWDDRPNRRGFSPDVWCRALLHRACQEDRAVARRVSDLLDLLYLDTVVSVRCADPGELEERLTRWIDDPQGDDLPGLLWSLCTDARDEVHALGVRACHEATTAAFRSLVEPRSS